MPIIKGKKPFAVLLCNFSDSVNPQPFTVTAAALAMAENDQFWQKTSFGNVRLDGSYMSEWITLPITNSAFKTKGADGMIQYAKDHSGIDQSKYVGFIIIFSEPVGTAWTHGNGAIFEPSIVRSADICHEMTHILGEPRHSFDFTNRKDADWSPPGQYFDQTDLMSNQNCWSTPSIFGIFSGAGPQHCAIWKNEFGWYDGLQVWRISNANLDSLYETTVTLKARDTLPGLDYACIFFLDYSVEFAIARDYDAGLPKSGIIIHQSIAGVPYVEVPDITNSPDQKMWSVGDIFTVSQGPVATKAVHVRVVSIDIASSTAVVDIWNGPVAPLQAVQILAIRKGRHRPTGTPGDKPFDWIAFVGVSDGAGGLYPIPRSAVIAWIESGRNTFFVRGADGSSANVIVESLHGLHDFIKTVPDGSTADNLLSLPSF